VRSIISQTLIVRELSTRDRLYAISAIPQAGKLYFHGQDGTPLSDEEIAFLENLLRDASERKVRTWDSPICLQPYKTFFADVAAYWLHMQHLPA
jgi:hypothetical protein